MGSPPLARGTARRYAHGVLLPGITPACAGNRVPTCAHQIGDGDHPRLRGEQHIAVFLSDCGLGSPPLARGTGLSPVGRARMGGITPACAGNSKRIVCTHTGYGDHPRLRGEQTTGKLLNQEVKGSPPLARGTEVSIAQVGTVQGITPACAGNSRPFLAASPYAQDHPRLRGEQTKKRLVVSCILQYRFSFFNQFFVDMFC